MFNFGLAAVKEEKISPEECIVSTDGGRYDVDVDHRTRTAVFWEEAPSAVKRCSWFFKGSLESRYTPYEEEMAEKLEEEYHNTILHRYAPGKRRTIPCMLLQFIYSIFIIIMVNHGRCSCYGQSVAQDFGISARKQNYVPESQRPAGFFQLRSGR